MKPSISGDRAFITRTVTSATARVTARVQHSFSFHSLARYYERTGTRSDSHVIMAMIDGLVFDPADCRLGDEARIGNWRGTIKQNSTADGEIQMWCARTWIK
jgi:hypothetical protein